MVKRIKIIGRPQAVGTHALRAAGQRPTYVILHTSAYYIIRQKTFLSITNLHEII